MSSTVNVRQQGVAAWALHLEKVHASNNLPTGSMQGKKRGHLLPFRPPLTCKPSQRIENSSGFPSASYSSSLTLKRHSNPNFSRVDLRSSAVFSPCPNQRPEDDKPRREDKKGYTQENITNEGYTAAEWIEATQTLQGCKPISSLGRGTRACEKTLPKLQRCVLLCWSRVSLLKGRD